MNCMLRNATQLLALGHAHITVAEIPWDKHPKEWKNYRDGARTKKFAAGLHPPPGELTALLLIAMCG